MINQWFIVLIVLPVHLQDNLKNQTWVIECRTNKILVFSTQMHIFWHLSASTVSWWNVISYLSLLTLCVDYTRCKDWPEMYTFPHFVSIILWRSLAEFPRWLWYCVNHSCCVQTEHEGRDAPEVHPSGDYCTAVEQEGHDYVTDRDEAQSTVKNALSSLTLLR